LALLAHSPADSVFSATLIRAALYAAAPDAAALEREPARYERAALEALSRPAAPPASGETDPEESDGRWFWAAVLALLGVETLLRRSPASPADQEDHVRDAA
jgi:hypothetical protein